MKNEEMARLFSEATPYIQKYHGTVSYTHLMQKYQQNIRMVDRMPDALSGAMGNQMYVATFSTREGMEQFLSLIHI